VYRHLGSYVNELYKIITTSLCTNDSICPFDLSRPIPTFLMTDDANELNALSKFPQFEFVYSKTTRHKDFTWDMFTEEQSKNRTETFFTLTTEMAIMSKAQVYVGTDEFLVIFGGFVTDF
jgi:hypothetical protein